MKIYRFFVRDRIESPGHFRLWNVNIGKDCTQIHPYKFIRSVIFHECNEKILTQFHASQKSETCSVATLRRWAGRPSMKKSESYFHCGQGHFSASEAEQHEDGDYMSYALEVIIGSYLLWKILSEFDWATVICLIFHCLLPHIEGS